MSLVIRLLLAKRPDHLDCRGCWRSDSHVLICVAMNRDPFESTANARAGNTQASVNLELREMPAALERLAITGQEHAGLLVEGQRHVRAEVEVCMDRARSTHDNHAKCGYPVAEDVFVGVCLGQLLQCTNYGAVTGCSRTKSPITLHVSQAGAAAKHRRGS